MFLMKYVLGLEQKFNMVLYSHFLSWIALSSPYLSWVEYRLLLLLFTFVFYFVSWLHFLGVYKVIIQISSFPNAVKFNLKQLTTRSYMYTRLSDPNLHFNNLSNSPLFFNLVFKPIANPISNTDTSFAISFSVVLISIIISVLSRNKFFVRLRVPPFLPLGIYYVRTLY